MPYADPSAHRARRSAYDSTYYQKNKKRLDAKSRAWREANLERSRAISRASYERNIAGYLLASAKNRAKRRGIKFQITREDIILPERCPVLGIKLNYKWGKGGSPIPNSPSIDRINPKLGYVPGNICVVSFRANTLKSDASVSEMQAVLKYMRRYR